MNNKVLLSKKLNKTLILTLNRPERLNALNVQLLNKLLEELEKASLDKEVLGIIITGTGKGFCAGGDLKERLNFFEEDSTIYGDVMLTKLRNICTLIESIGKPVIAAINGHAIGGGLELAFACDIRLLNENAKIGLTEPRVGMIPGAGGTQRLPRLIGASRAKELLMIAEPIDAQTAKEYGTVNKLIESESNIIEEAENILQKIYKNAPLAIKMIKFSINKGMQMSLSEGLDFEASCTSFLKNSFDRKEGITAFQEKREPNFIGK